MKHLPGYRTRNSDTLQYFTNRDWLEWHSLVNWILVHPYVGSVDQRVCSGNPNVDEVSAAVKDFFQFSFGHWVQPGTWDTGGLSGRLLQALGFGGASSKSAGGAGGTGKSFNGADLTFLPTRRAREAMRSMMVSSMWTLMLALDFMKWRRCMIPIRGVLRHHRMLWDLYCRCCCAFIVLFTFALSQAYIVDLIGSSQWRIW